MEWVALAAAVTAGVGSAVMQRNAGIQQSNEMKRAARAEGDAARGREIERKRALLRALSAQNARAGAMGATMEGSLAAIARNDIRDATNDLLVDRSNTRERIADLQAGARFARNQGNLGAAVSLLDTGAKTYSAWPGGGKGKGGGSGGKKLNG